MPVWQVAVVLNLTLAIGLGVGYAGWGRRVEAVDRELEGARARVERLERERLACVASGRAGEQQWEGRGVVRAAYPQIAGLLSARTTGFRVEPAALRVPIRIGDAIRFSLRGTVADDVALVEIAPW
jgi:hypothetical protein